MPTCNAPKFLSWLHVHVSTCVAEETLTADGALGNVVGAAATVHATGFSSNISDGGIDEQGSHIESPKPFPSSDADPDPTASTSLQGTAPSVRATALEGVDPSDPAYNSDVGLDDPSLRGIAPSVRAKLALQLAGGELVLGKRDGAVPIRCQSRWKRRLRNARYKGATLLLLHTICGCGGEPGDAYAGVRAMQHTSRRVTAARIHSCTHRS